MELMSSASQSFGLTEVLQLSHFDYVYTRADGNYLFTHDGKRILDFAQGAGTGILGHNHPEIIDTLVSALQAGVPQNAQFSFKPTIKRLVEKINMAVSGKADSFIGIPANSGTEAMEIALKHASLSYHHRLACLLEECRQSFREQKKLLKEGKRLEIPPNIFEKTPLSEAGPPAGHLDMLIERLETYHSSLLVTPSQFLALQRSFHGKTLGSLRITHNHRYRHPFLKGDEHVYFISPDDPASLEAILSSRIFHLYSLSLDKSLRLHLKAIPMSSFEAFIYEPVQGEGGIFPLDKDFLLTAQDMCHKAGIQVIADEIQTFGRLGHICATTAMELDPDYITLAKGLGGGLCKAAMALIRREIYQKQFDLIHSSTFAGDELSSLAAMKTIDMLTRENSRLLRQGYEMGQYLMARLLQVKARYPQVIYDIRGAGLMIGIEFFPLEKSVSWTIRQASRFFGSSSLPIASYLLNQRGIRVLPVLSNPHTIRLEPSLSIEKGDIEQCVESISRLCEVLERGNGYGFIQHHLQQIEADEPERGTCVYPAVIPPSQHRQDLNQAAFLCHPFDAGDLLDYDPSLRNLGLEGAEKFLRCNEQYFEPELITRSTIRSSTGSEIQISFIGIGFTSQRLAELMAARKVKLPREKIRRALEIAYQMGCSVCGLGQYTSIVTRNGLLFDYDHINLTTGNALTAGMALEALISKAGERGLSLAQVSTAVVGAGGNIGQIISELLSDSCPSLLLIGSGRSGSRERLVKVGYQIANRAYKRVFEEGLPPQGFTRNDAVLEIMKRARSVDSHQRGKFIYEEIVSHPGESMPLRIQNQIEDLRNYQVIVTATNASSPILYPEHISRQVTVICDIGTPPNVHESVRNMHPQVEIIKGGIVALPHEEKIDLPGYHLSPGRVFACIAETILLAMEGFKGHYSYGRLNSEQVTNILHIAARHGFKLDIPKYQRVSSDE
ncbi:MAG: aminotransferase class III-fold pyridoxal phosphate-dependent enzyme [bacterium]